MLIELVYDLDQYKWVLVPIEHELRQRNHQVFSSKTRSSKNVPAECNGSIGIQNVAYTLQPKEPWDERVDLDDAELPTSPRFFINHGTSASKWWNLDFPIDYFLSQSEYWTKTAEQKRQHLGRDFKVIGNLGYPKMDVLVNLYAKREEFRKQIKDAFGLGISPIVVCFPTYKKPNMDDPWLRNFSYKELVKELDKHYSVFVAPHQMDDTNEFTGVLPPARVSTAYEIQRLQLFVSADLIVSDTSGAAYEACGLDIPVVLTDGIHKLESMHDKVDLGPVATMDNIIDTIDSQLANPNEYRERRLWWAEYILGPRDAQASSRIVDVLEELCQPGQ